MHLCSPRSFKLFLQCDETEQTGYTVSIRCKMSSTKSHGRTLFRNADAAELVSMRKDHEVGKLVVEANSCRTELWDGHDCWGSFGWGLCEDISG